MKKNNNIFKELLNNKRVNNYTKLMIILNTLNFYEDYYIPNKKLMNMLNINKNRVIVLLEQLRKDRIIAIFYKGSKRYFTFIANNEESSKQLYNSKNDVFNYNWLDDD